MKMTKLKKFIILIVVTMMLLGSILPTGEKVVWAEETEMSVIVFKYDATTQKFNRVESGLDYTFENGEFKVTETGKYIVLSMYDTDQVEYVNANINKKGYKGLASWSELGIGWNDEGLDMPVVYDIEAEEEINVSTGEGDGALYGVDEEESLLDKLEHMLSLMINGIAGLINSIVTTALISKEDRAKGERITIDKLVFNLYPETQLTYFYEPDDPTLSDQRSVIIWGREGRNPDGGWKISPVVLGRDAINGKASNGESGLYATVNSWYNLFRGVAVVGYMIILIYMGIRIILSSTGRDLSRYKSLFMYWVIGVIILFFYPYVMKYAIILNDTFVKIVYSSVEDSMEEIKYGAIEGIEITEASNSGDMQFDYQERSAFQGGNDYMSVIADSAVQNKRLALSLAYLIMTWQLITLIVHYYKRVFMTGFLIVIFPLVALSYAIDKIADGKSQAFNKWNKEFIINVFIQSFHAIIYVFICGTIYAGGAAGIKQYDFILIIVGVTFLFTGEEIIKKIFSQESSAGTVKSLVQTAAETYAKVTVAKAAISTVGRPLVGKNSVINKIRTGRNETKAAGMKLDMYDKYASPMTPPDVGKRLSGYEKEMQKPGANAAHVREVSNAVATLNNPNSSSYAELARAYEIVQKERRLNPDNELLKDLRYSEADMEAMAGVENYAAGLMASGIVNPIVIERNVKMALGIDVDSDEIPPAKERQLNMLMAHMGIYGADRGYTRAKTEKEIQDAAKDISGLEERMNVEFYSVRRADWERESDRLYTATYREMGENLTEEEKQLARDIAVLRNLNSAAFTNITKLRAVEEIQKRLENEDGKNTIKMDALLSTVKDDMGMTSHILARKMIDNENLQNTDSDDRRAAKELLSQGRLNLGKDHVIEYHDGYEGEHQRDTYYNDELAYHEMIEMMYSRDDIRTEIEEEYGQDKTKEVMDEFVFGDPVEHATQRNDIYDSIMSGVGSEEEKRLMVSMEIINRRSEGLYDADEQLKALNYVAEYAKENDRARDFINQFETQQEMDFDSIRLALSAKVRQTRKISEDSKETANETIESIRLNELTDRLHTERRRTNQAERKLTADFAQDYLARHGIDINEGGIDTNTRYFMDQTREDILVEQRNARQNFVRRLAGFKTHGTAGGRPGESKEDIFRTHHGGKTYEENMEAYNKHFYGDQ